jgi:hypothetical protein
MATSYDITTIQGDNLQIALSLKDQYSNPINLSGYDVRGVVKYAYGFTGISGLIVDLAPVVDSGVNGSFYTSGLININIPSYTMASVPVGSFVYDIERFPKGISTGNSIKLLRGKFIVSPEVTAM